MRLSWVERMLEAGLIGLGVALFIMQIVLGPGYRRAAEHNRIRVIPMPAVRGSILDRHGTPIVEDRLSFNLALVPQEVRDVEPILATLSGALRRPVARLRRAYQRGVAAPCIPVVIAQDLEPSMAFALEERRLELPGVMVLPAPRRHYPFGRAIGPLIGYLSLVSPDQLQRLKPYGITMRDWVGHSGLEQLYDAALRGEDGGIQVEVDHRGRVVHQLGVKMPVRGHDITLTIDAPLQQHCARLLAGRRGAVVVMALESGDLLAVVSSPGFDPAAFVDPDRDEEVIEYLHDPDRPLFNRVVRGAVPPGSVFKIVTAYAGLATHTATPETTFVCPGSFQLGTAVFDCWYAPGHGPQTVVEALEHSCNVFFYHWGLLVGPEAIATAARQFGFGAPSGVDLPGESAGLVPDPAWKRARWHQPWYKGETANFAIGQGSLLVTPMQVLRMITTAALETHVPRPHLLKAIGEHPVDPPPTTPLALDRDALQTIQRGLDAVVNADTGTGRLARTPGVAAAGKTGTAQAGEGPSHAWFCGYAQTPHPQVAVVVFVEHGGKGGEVAAGIAGQIFEMLYAAGALPK